MKEAIRKGRTREDHDDLQQKVYAMYAKGIKFSSCGIVGEFLN